MLNQNLIEEEAWWEKYSTENHKNVFSPVSPFTVESCENLVTLQDPSLSFKSASISRCAPCPWQCALVTAFKKLSIKPRT